MKVSEAAKLFIEYHKSHSKENSVRAYNLVISQLCEEFGAENPGAITTEKMLSFLKPITVIETVYSPGATSVILNIPMLSVAPPSTVPSITTLACGTGSPDCWSLTTPVTA